jgi:hypothetical protein
VGPDHPRFGIQGELNRRIPCPETRRLTKPGRDVAQPRSSADVIAMWKAYNSRYGKRVKETGINGET